MANFRDGYLTQGENLGNLTNSITLTQVTTAVDPGMFGIIVIYSDSSIAADRSIILSPSVIPGQEITLCFMSDSPYACQLTTLSASYMRLNKTWTPQQYDKLTLQWIDNTWQEMSRFTFQDNTPVSVEPYSSKWSSSANVRYVSNANVAIMSGSFTSLEDNNDDPLGTFPTGYFGVFSIPCVRRSSGGTITIVDMGTSGSVFGMTPTASTGDVVYVGSLCYVVTG